MENSRDRETTIRLDSDVKAVLEFMQRRIPTAKLVGVAESLPGLARLLWGHYTQEPCQSLVLRGLTATEVADRSRLDASVSGLERPSADGGSVAAGSELL